MPAVREISLLFLLLLPALTIIAQPEKKDSILLSVLQKETINTYYNYMQENAPFYNGAEYTGHGQNNVGHAFWGTGNAYAGFMEYDGVLYNNIMLQYDIVDDAIIISDYTQNYLIKLNSKKIARFSIYNQLFVQPVFYSNAGAIPGEGFYEQLYNGSTTVLVKRTKKLVNKQSSDEKSIGKFLSFSQFFIQKGNTYNAIARKKDIIGIYQDKKNEIRRYISDNKLSFRKNPEIMLEKVAAYYDQLKK